MLFILLSPLSDDIGALRLFSFITFRTGGAILTALLISLVARGATLAWRYPALERSLLAAPGP